MIIGIDPSLTGFAACRSDGEHYLSTSSPRGSTVKARRKRLDLLLDPFLEWLEAANPEHIFIEGYFGQLTATTLRLIELGWALRSAVLVVCPGALVYEVPPSRLKKVITGRGNANKTLMATTVALAAGVQLADDNVADAMALMMVGRMVIGEAPVPKEHRKIISEIKASAYD